MKDPVRFETLEEAIYRTEKWKPESERQWVTYHTPAREMLVGITFRRPRILDSTPPSLTYNRKDFFPVSHRSEKLTFSHACLFGDVASHPEL